MKSIYFAERTWPELKTDIKKKTMILLPVGQIEEHGKHLPVNADSVIAEETAKAVALKSKIPVLVMPIVWSAYSNVEMTRWPGTIIVRTRVFMDLIQDICSSLIKMGFKKIVIMNGHGHNIDALKVVVREIADLHNTYIVASDVGNFAADAVKKYRKSAPGGCIHGCEFETSLLLYLNSKLVDMKKTTKVDMMRYSSKFVPADGFSGSKKVFWSTWGIQKSKTGIYGDPTVACKAFGEKVFRDMVNNYVEFLKEYHKHKRNN